MTAMLNPANETIRIDRKYLPLLLELKTAERSGDGPAATAALASLEAADVLSDGRLHPMADAILEIIAEPGLVVSIERLRAGVVATSTMWATPAVAVIGTRVDSTLYELRLASPALLRFHLFETVHLRPRPETAGFAHELPAELMLAAEAAIHDGDPEEATRLLTDSAIDAAAAIVKLLTVRVASWRVHSIWSGTDGPASGAAYGMDCGKMGNVLVDVDAAGPDFRLRAAGFAEVTQSLRETLPWAG